MPPRDPNAPVPPEHVAALLAAATAPCDRALVALVAHAGLRAADACALRVEDVAGDTARLAASPTTPLRRLAPLPLPVAEAVRLAAGDRAAGPLLVTRTGTPLDPRRAVARLRALARRAGVDPAPTLPQLRAHALSRR
ncbi:tyrosine-type recombinase/integrase [Rubrivirga sp. S365]|uniref:tyrosine-type recombinase/integrase n=1 Tax=Rubrivirga sp. S365 TaxID=3076080 RepID=UPI0028C621E3|nr:tyrosine-type recombinase/integrase [Rubrivirga sp. S365]MDT7858160.1 tyrosine-type recombinase/integrase [Rubrivirga sp. S365]